MRLNAGALRGGGAGTRCSAMPSGHQAVIRQPHTSLDADSVRAAYRRWAKVYDTVFGGVSAAGRRRAVSPRTPCRVQPRPRSGRGHRAGTAPLYAAKRITGIDLSADMLEFARNRVRDVRLRNVEALHEMDAEQTVFEDGRFDIAVAMFVASVVPNPRQLLAEMRRVVRPGRPSAVRQPFRRRARPALVGRARARAGVAQARLAPGFFARRAAAERRPGAGQLRAGAVRSAFSRWCASPTRVGGVRQAVLRLDLTTASDTPCRVVRRGSGPGRECRRMEPT